MLKVAVPDPVQLKLRQNKKLWNKEVSTFINDLINFKKTMNGAPSKFHPEKGTIKDPIPADPATIIGVLADDFRGIAEKGNAIIQEQINYSKTRRKSQPKVPVVTTPAGPTPATPAVPETVPQAPDLAKQLAAFEQKYGLIAEASNPISRFFTRLLTPTFGVSEAARIRKYRMSLLDAAVKTYRALGKLQVEIVKSSPASINSSNAILHQAWNDWTLIVRGLSTYKMNMPKEVVDAGGEITPPEDTTSVAPDAPGKPQDDPSKFPSLKQALDAINDFNANSGRFTSDNVGDLVRAIEKFYMTKNLATAQVVVKNYQNLLKTLNTKYQTTGTNLGEVADMKEENKEANKPVPPPTPPTTATTNSQIEKVSQDFLKKWLGKTTHQLSVFDKTSVYRLDIYKMAGEMRKTINEIMNSLEKGMSSDELDPLVTKVNKDMSALRMFMRSLHLNAPPPKKTKAPGKETTTGVLDNIF